MSTQELTWLLKEKRETVAGVHLAFERTEWFSGEDPDFFDVPAETPGAAWVEAGTGRLTLDLTAEQAAAYVVGEQYRFLAELRPLVDRGDETAGVAR